MSAERDRHRDIRNIMTDVAELREEVAVHGATGGLWRGLLSLFLVLRLGLAFVTVAFPQGGALDDSGDNLTLAHQLANGGEYGLQESGQASLRSSPGYVVILAGFEVAFGDSLHWVTLLQLLISGLTSLVLLRLGIELQRPRAGLLAAWFYALSPNVMLWSLTISTEVIFAMLLALASLLTIRAVNSYKRWWPAATGLALGGMAYIQPIALALAPFWAAVVFRFRQARYGMRRGLTSALLLILLTALAVVPWAYGNWGAYGRFAFSTAPGTRWVNWNLAEVVAQAEGTELERAQQQLDTDRGAVQLTLDVAAQYPTEFAKAQLVGVMRTLAGSDLSTLGSVLGADSLLGRILLSGATPERPDRLLQALLGRDDANLGILLLVHTIALAFSVGLLLSAAFGALLARLDSDAGKLLRALAVSNTLVLILLPGAAGQARFRVPAEAFLAMLSGLGVSYVVDRLLLWARRRKIRRQLNPNDG